MHHLFIESIFLTVKPFIPRFSWRIVGGLQSNFQIQQKRTMNPNSSFQEKNQFMPNQQRGNDPMFQNFMRSCLNNPSFFETMKSFYDSQTSQSRTAAFKPSNNQSLATQNIPPFNAMNKKHESFSNPNGDQTQHQERSNDEAKSKRLASNPLLKYQPQPNSNRQTNSRKINSQETIPKNLDERPIKSQYTQAINTNPKTSVDLNSIKENQSINFDPQDRPIKPLVKNTQKQQIYRKIEEPLNNPNAESRQKVYRQFDQRPIKSMSRSQQQQYYIEVDKKQQKSSLSNTSSVQANPSSFEDRPIKGANKDFKQLIKEQFPEPFGEQIQEPQSEERKIQPRTFLKRGSRQHLSSAATRSKQPKKVQQDLNKSGLTKQRDLTPQNRSTSQNRILGKKNTKENNDRSINKGRPKQDEPLVVQNNKSKPPLQISKNPKHEVKKNIEQKPAVSSKKKAKNVFDDNSESSSSSEQQPYFKATSQHSQQLNTSNNNEDKLQVISNVYLTHQQLQQILQKYGKASKAEPRQSESDKIKSLRDKYTELCKVVQEKRQVDQRQLERQKEQFQRYKAQQLKKLKNEKKVMERQVKSGSNNALLQKQKQQLQALSLQLEKQREQFKKKEKNNKIIIEKYKKQNEELKAKLQRLQVQQASVSKKSLYSAKESLDEKPSIPKNNPINKAPRIEQQPPKEQLSYKDIKKAKDTKPSNKLKYQYAQEDPIIVKTKPSNVQKEEKIQNKWVSNNIHSDSQDSQGEEIQVGKQETKSDFEWSPAMKLSDLTKVDLSIKMVSDKMINAMFKHQNNIEYKKYLQATQSSSRTVVNTNRNAKNCYVANLYSDRSKELIYDNGTRKQSFQNGYTIVYFKNGDIKQTLSDKTVLYYFKEKQVDQITLPNNVNIYRFENNQVQFHFPSGEIEIRHSDGTIKVLGEHTRR